MSPVKSATLSQDAVSPEKGPGKATLALTYDSQKKRREEESEVVIRFNRKPSAGIPYAAATALGTWQDIC